MRKWCNKCIFLNFPCTSEAKSAMKFLLTQSIVSRKIAYYTKLNNIFLETLMQGKLDLE